MKECQDYHEKMVTAKKAVRICLFVVQLSWFIDCFLQVPRELEYKDILRWKKFGDGFPNLFIDNVKEMAGKDGKCGSPVFPEKVRSLFAFQ